jgi:hypothetical protein
MACPYGRRSSLGHGWRLIAVKQGQLGQGQGHASSVPYARLNHHPAIGDHNGNGIANYWCSDGHDYVLCVHATAPLTVEGGTCRYAARYPPTHLRHSKEALVPYSLGST